MCRKTAEVARNINDAFSQGTANKCTVQWWFRKFRNGDDSLKNKGRPGRPPTIDDDDLKLVRR